MNLWEMVTGIYSCLTQPHTQHQWDGRGECKQPPWVIPSSAVPEKSHRCISADWGVTKTLFWNNLNCLYSSLQPTVYLFPFQLTILYCLLHGFGWTGETTCASKLSDSARGGFWVPPLLSNSIYQGLYWCAISSTISISENKPHTQKLCMRDWRLRIKQTSYDSPGEKERSAAGWPREILIKTGSVGASLPWTVGTTIADWPAPSLQILQTCYLADVTVMLSLVFKCSFWQLFFSPFIPKLKYLNYLVSNYPTPSAIAQQSYQDQRSNRDQSKRIDFLQEGAQKKK